MMMRLAINLRKIEQIIVKSSWLFERKTLLYGKPQFRDAAPEVTDGIRLSQSSEFRHPMLLSIRATTESILHSHRMNKARILSRLIFMVIIP